MIEKNTGIETRAVIPGHLQRGGSPCAYDRVLSTKFGVAAAKLISDGNFGNTVAYVNSSIAINKLSNVAGKTKFVPEDCSMVKTAKYMGLSLGV